LSFLLVAVLAFYFSSYRKDSLDYSTFSTTPELEVQSPIDRESKGKFFQSTSHLQPEFQLLIENLKKQDSLKNFITQAWVQKNGLPVWDKTFSNLPDNSHSSFDGGTGDDFYIYFTPLKSAQSNKIQSYIVSYQKDTLQYHRLYNFEELLKITNPAKKIREEVVGVLSAFGYFEKIINNKNSLAIGEPFNITFENATMKWGSSTTSQVKSRSACADISVTGGVQVVMGWGYASSTICWDVLTSYSELSWSTGVSNGPSAGGWPSSGSGGTGAGGFNSWSGTSYNSLNISDLMSALYGEIPLQTFISQYSSDAAFINFVVGLNTRDEAYVGRLYANYNKGFSNSELVLICKDITFSNQIDEYFRLSNNSDAVNDIKTFLDQTANEPVIEIDGIEYTGKQLVYADRIMRKVFDKTKNNVDIRSKFENELNLFIQTDLGKKMLSPDGLWNPSKYSEYKRLLTHVWEDHFFSSIVSNTFYDYWNSKVINAPTNAETAYNMVQRGIAARIELENFNEKIIEAFVELSFMSGAFRPLAFNSQGRIFSLNYAPKQGKLIVDPLGNFSDSERKAAIYMRNLGKNTELRIPSGIRSANGSTSDLLIDGKTYDVYTPKTSNADNIIGNIFKKRTQCNGVVLDLSESNVNPADLRDIMRRLQGAAQARGTDLNIEQVITINTNNF
jgi:hypothetical protein